MAIKCIYGAPCSGKSTYVQENATDKDLLFDYDHVRNSITKLELHNQGTEAQREMTNKLRYTFLANAKESEAENVFFITTKVSDSVRELLGEDAEYIEMEATEEECLDRLEKDDSRKDKEYILQGN